MRPAALSAPVFGRAVPVDTVSVAVDNPATVVGVCVVPDTDVDGTPVVAAAPVAVAAVPAAAGLGLLSSDMGVIPVNASASVDVAPSAVGGGLPAADMGGLFLTGSGSAAGAGIDDIPSAAGGGLPAEDIARVLPPARRLWRVA